MIDYRGKVETIKNSYFLIRKRVITESNEVTDNRTELDVDLSESMDHVYCSQLVKQKTSYILTFLVV